MKYDFNLPALDTVLRLLPSRPDSGTSDREEFNDALDQCGSWASMADELDADDDCDICYSDFYGACDEIGCEDSNEEWQWDFLERGIKFLADGYTPTTAFLYPRSKKLTLVVT